MRHEGWNERQRMHSRTATRRPAFSHSPHRHRFHAIHRRDSRAAFASMTRGSVVGAIT